MGKEIERKFLIKKMPDNIETYRYHIIEQGYLTTNPVIRVRRSDDEYYMTYKGKGLLEREEYNLPLTKEAYDSLIVKAEGNIIRKKRYLIPIEIPYNGVITQYTVELDVFAPPFEPLVLAEVEFPSIDEADAFELLSWFDKDVTGDVMYHNSNMSKRKFD